MNVLILGGTTEATAIGRALAGDARFAATLSYAGRTQAPLAQAIPTRSGGFGGIDGLAAYLVDHRIDALIDATHPFAAQITAHAVAAARQTGTKLLVVLRPAWRAEPGDHWTEVPDMAAAAQALGRAPRRVLLTVGQKDLAPFAAAPWHEYTVRSIEPPSVTLPPTARFIAARGPFAPEAEMRLLRERRIEMIVTKNSGGGATEAKLAAARALGVPVVMVARPPPPAAEIAPSAEAALAWLAGHAALRGV